MDWPQLAAALTLFVISFGNGYSSSDCSSYDSGDLRQPLAVSGATHNIEMAFFVWKK